MPKAVFLDRDGVINDSRKPVNNATDLVIYPWAAEAIKSLNNGGYYVFIVTNQGGIEMGYFKEKDLEEIHDFLLNQLSNSGAIIDDIEYCPHFKTKCQCRKPGGGMILKLGKQYNIKLDESFMVGDRDVDILAGIDAGCKTIKIGSPYNKANYSVENLKEAAKVILKTNGLNLGGK